MSIFSYAERYTRIRKVILLILYQLKQSNNQLLKLDMLKIKRFGIRVLAPNQRYNNPKIESILSNTFHKTKIRSYKTLKSKQDIWIPQIQF